MRISDWSSDVCSSDLTCRGYLERDWPFHFPLRIHPSRNRDGSCHSTGIQRLGALQNFSQSKIAIQTNAMATANKPMDVLIGNCSNIVTIVRSEEHTSELQSLMRISYAVFCLKKKTTRKPI